MLLEQSRPAMCRRLCALMSPTSTSLQLYNIGNIVAYTSLKHTHAHAHKLKLNQIGGINNTSRGGGQIQQCLKVWG